MLDVEFLAAQLPDGSNVLFCLGASGRHDPQTPMLLVDGVRGFEGRTADGVHVATAGSIWPQSFPGRVPVEWDWKFFCGYNAQMLRVGTRSGIPESVRYGLTNVRPPWRPELPLRLESGNATTKAELLMVPGFRSIFDRIRALKGTAVTCELAIMAQENLTKNQMDQVAADVSYLLSVAQGCKVTWIYRDEEDADGLLCTEHRMSQTIPFNAFELVPTHPSAVSEEFTDLQQFVEMTYPTYVRRRDSWGLGLGPIDFYLEAKAEADYLETRGAKLAVALESLKHRYLRSGEASIDQNALQDMLRGLKRKSFSQIIEHFAADIGLHLNSKERGMFVTSRNVLVHQGQFYCIAVQAGEAKPTRTPKDTPVEEYFFMVNILDRIILALLGYSGPYFDRREPGAPRIASLP